MTATPQVHGSTTPAFEPVRAAFADIAACEPGLEAQLAVYHQGVPVVDLWTGGESTGDSLLALYSTGKGAAFLVLALLVQEGAIDLDRPVAEYWAEFATAGKSGITVRQLASHQAGLLGVAGGVQRG
ncbi:serine hydrolase [Saccharopolyspora sp. WRP15-2]|uniref:Serine hydrolase n=1 Tax=Saccharopolyspora oryzae TaxID=2997343 RepID=A0ABT4UV24_9PSEU|nr:serine hydrolase domain-containing protein [Saccharopolyspora oryzae]MDA3625566.1 serine hydrolase [Saccharopolyspora oryzae]